MRPLSFSSLYHRCRSQAGPSKAKCWNRPLRFHRPYRRQIVHRESPESVHEACREHRHSNEIGWRIARPSQSRSSERPSRTAYRAQNQQRERPPQSLLWFLGMRGYKQGNRHLVLCLSVLVVSQRLTRQVASSVSPNQRHICSSCHRIAASLVDAHATSHRTQERRCLRTCSSRSHRPAIGRAQGQDRRLASGLSQEMSAPSRP